MQGWGRPCPGARSAPGQRQGRGCARAAARPALLWPAARLAGCACVEGLVAFVAALLRPGFQKRNREPSVPCGGCDRFCSTASTASAWQMKGIQESRCT